MGIRNAGGRTSIETRRSPPLRTSSLWARVLSFLVWTPASRFTCLASRSLLLASLAFGRGLGRGVAALRVVLPISDGIGLSARGSAGQPVPKLVVGLGLADQVAARLGRLAAASEEGSGLQRRQVQVNRPLPQARPGLED